MPTLRKYSDYQNYIEFQKQKSSDPVRIQKWLNEEWNVKLNGFIDEFKKLGSIITPDANCLCLGARTGQEVVALKNLGVKNAVGIDIVPHEPHVVLGDIHNLNFDSDTFDFVYTNIMDHSVDPKKMVSEIERVLKVGGHAYIQIQLGVNQDEYTEFEIKNPFYDVISLFDKSFCVHVGPIKQDFSTNFAAMNFEMIFRKDKELVDLFEKFGTLDTVHVPKEYEKIWNDVNLEIQQKKLDENMIFEQGERQKILDKLMKRAYYLTCLASIYSCKNIAEVGTAQGWQYYSFCEYARSVSGKVSSCDPRDVRNEECKDLYEEKEKIGSYYKMTSKEMASNLKDVDMFYIDGLHDENDVFDDVSNLISCQSASPIWVFDDFDTRFGCFKDIALLCQASRCFKVIDIGKVASGNESHQAIVKTKFVL